MSNPKNLRYTEEHEWTRVEDDGSVTVGITDHAQDALGDVVYAELPSVGDELVRGGAFGVVESVKAVSDLFAPCDGEVVAVNESLEDAPEQINKSPYEDGWIVRIRPSDPSQIEALMDAAAYDAFLAQESH